MNKKIILTSEILQSLENLKEYINDMQAIEKPTLLNVGMRLGIVMSELAAVENDVTALQRELQNDN